MGPKINNVSSSSSLIILLLCFFLFSSTQTLAFNITRLLSRYPGYGTMNKLLTQTKLAGEINRRRTITVLAIPDEQIAGLATKGPVTVKRVLSNHVILDYYDIVKLHNLKNGSTMLVTLYQSSGAASERTGFLNMVETKDGQVRFSVAGNGTGHEATLIRLVAAQPFNISVLAVSRPIVAPGIDAGPAGPPLKAVVPPPTAARRKKISPSQSHAAKAPAEAPEEADEGPSPAGGPSEDSPAPAPADGPTANDDDDQDQDAPTENGASPKGFALITLSIGLIATLL